MGFDPKQFGRDASRARGWTTIATMLRGAADATEPTAMSQALEVVRERIVAFEREHTAAQKLSVLDASLYDEIFRRIPILIVTAKRAGTGDRIAYVAQGVRDLLDIVRELDEAMP